MDGEIMSPYREPTFTPPEAPPGKWRERALILTSAILGVALMKGFEWGFFYLWDHYPLFQLMVIMGLWGGIPTFLWVGLLEGIRTGKIDPLRL